MNTGVITASVVYCTECGTRTRVYASRNSKEHKIRYRECPSCRHKMVTKMRLGERQAVEEKWTPLSADERMKAARSARHVKLDEQAVKEIRYLHSTGEYTYRDLAFAYEVHMTTIGRALSKMYWKNVETPKSLVG